MATDHAKWFLGKPDARDETTNPLTLVCLIGTIELRYQLWCMEDLHAMLKAYSDRMLLGCADELNALAQWLKEQAVTHVEHGRLCKPVYNLLEGSFQILVINTEHLKVSGRKTDIADAEWRVGPVLTGYACDKADST